MNDLEKQRESLQRAVNQANILADSEALARRIAEEQISEHQKEKVSRDNELRGTIDRLRDDLVAKDHSLYQNTEQYKRRTDDLIRERNELEFRLGQAVDAKQNGVSQNGYANNDTALIATLQKQLDSERTLKQQVSGQDRPYKEL